MVNNSGATMPGQYLWARPCVEFKLHHPVWYWFGSRIGPITLTVHLHLLLISLYTGPGTEASSSVKGQALRRIGNAYGAYANAPTPFGPVAHRF